MNALLQHSPQVRATVKTVLTEALIEAAPKLTEAQRLRRASRWLSELTIEETVAMFVDAVR
jgi:hypothetical protein